jgi:hypothetical protein
LENHTDRRIILSLDREFKSLYDWSLQELDAKGNKVGRDQIPWDWSLDFTASELVLRDTLAIEPDYEPEAQKAQETSVREQQSISAKLHPGDGGDYQLTSYSMFGTDRTISSFELYIDKLSDGEEQEHCRAWGSVSYTYEDDLRNETTDDMVIFRLYVRPETFARYAAAIAASAVDEATFRVGRVPGFYSEWSPAISTSKIKVLTGDKEHKVEIPSGCKIEPPRLGAPMPAEFYLRRIAKLKMPSEEADDPEERIDGTGKVQPIERLAIADARTVKLLSSLRTAAWIIAGLLLLILLGRLR